MTTHHPARRLWRTLEPLHDIVYFHPGVRDAGLALGLKGFWDTYFGFRAAPLGTASAGTVTATFANFHPAMVARAVPSVWTRATPEACLAARLALCTNALRTAEADPTACAQAVDLLGPVVSRADGTGRPLFAANAALDVPDDPVAALWQLTTTLREHRGDGHVAALVGHGLSGLEAHLLQAGKGLFPAETIRSVRGWSVEEWEEAADALRHKGFLAGDELTARGRELLEEIETLTDELAWSGALHVLGPRGVDRVVDVLGPSVAALWSTGMLPAVNPTGLRPPA